MNITGVSMELYIIIKETQPRYQTRSNTSGELRKEKLVENINTEKLWTIGARQTSSQPTNLDEPGF